MTVIAPVAPMQPDIGHDHPGVRPGPPRWREARRRRRGAALAARKAAHRAELHGILGVLVGARSHLCEGWLQGTWFAVRPAVQPLPAVAAPGHNRARAPASACLVGAVVLTSGGRPAVREQRTQRSLDLLWHTLHRTTGLEAVRWCPGPALRTLQVHDLTRWNDAPGRSLDEVLALLDAAIGRLTRELHLDDAHCGERAATR
jgi:hypothetical protein